MQNTTAPSFRTRIFMSVALVFSGLGVTLLVLLGVDIWLIQPVFHELEYRQGLEDNRRVQAAVQDEISSLTGIAKDWGFWDDTYYFTENRNSLFIQSNYPNSQKFSENSRVDLLAIYDNNGDELLKGIFHPELGREINLEDFPGRSPGILSYIQPILQKEREVSGLLHTEKGLLFLVAVPILRSEEHGPARGTLMMGRFLSKAVLKEIAEKVNVPFELFLLNDRRLTPAEQNIFTEISGRSPDFKPELHSDFIYSVTRDIEKKPAFFWRTALRGEILKIGRQTGNILFLTFGIISFGLLVCLVVYRFRMKSTAEALQESESRYRNLFENIHIAMLLLDPETGCIIDANPAACSFYGWSREELLSLRIDALNLLSKEQIQVEMKLAASQKRNHFNFKHRLADGTIRDVEVYSGPIAVKGKPLLFSIIHDITPRLQAESERKRLERKNRQLQKAESLGRMAGSIAHLFNNLLSVVLGNLELVEGVLARNSKAHEYLSAAIQAARRSSDISGMMLTYMGHPTGKNEVLDLSEACRQSLPMVTAAIPRGITLKSDLQTPGLFVRAHLAGILRVLLHLITNSWEAIGSGPGRISLTTKILPASAMPKEYFSPTDMELDAESFACLEVADTGCGMAKETLDSVFDPFFTTKFAGRGLGIPVIQGIVKSWGGIIGVESTSGQGTIFRVILPLIVDGTTQKNEEQRNEGAVFRGDGSTILLVDEQEMIRKMTRVMLERLNFTVIPSAGGEEAVALYLSNKENIACIICAIASPEGESWQTLAEIYALNHQIPIIIYSGYDEDQVRNVEYDEIPCTYLNKPYTSEDLKTALQKVLGSYGPGLEGSWRPN